jgi:hypothetical protein
MNKLTLFIGLQSFVITQAVAQSAAPVNAPATITDSLVVSRPAGKQYEASPGKMFWWGKHYRREWAT